MPTRREGAARRAAARLQEQEQVVIARCDFEVFGLDGTWTGVRALGGWGGSDGQLGQLTLVHGDRSDVNGPLVVVETIPTVDPMPRGGSLNSWRPIAMEHTARSLVASMWHETGVYLEATRSTFHDAQPTARWDNAVILVNGEPVEFAALCTGPCWIAAGLVRDSVVGIQARGLEPEQLRLMSVEDLAIYVE